MALVGLILGYACLAFFILCIAIVGLSVLIAWGNQGKELPEIIP